MYWVNKQNNIAQPPTIEEYKNRPPHPHQLKGGLRTRGAFHKKSKPNRPLVSIITIVRNGKTHIEHAMNSVLGQIYDNIEYIIIDGASTDGTIDIIKKYDDRIAYWVSEPDEGISDAFNKGIALSTGDIIGIINADDWYEPNAVDQIVERMNEKQSDILYGKLQYWNGSQKIELVDANDDYLSRDMSLNHPTVFVRRVIFEKIGLFRREFKYAMDYEWLLRAKMKGMNFSYIEKCLANMLLAGISDKGWRVALAEVVKAKNLYFPSIFNTIFFLLQLFRGTTRRWLERIGLQFIVSFYHAHFSMVKKIKPKTQK